ncbi:hypothetical protein ABI59_22400 [Acidobacteria bacterium Mor1]|nr:hypothetical protein ABI59_22400 [Acidobacteria bacterium Mor1]
MKSALAVTATLILAGAGALGITMSGEDSKLHEHLRHLGHHIHGSHGGSGHGSMAGLFEEGELDTQQLERLVAADRAFTEFHRNGFGSMQELHERLLAEYENGATDAASVRGIVDQQFDRMREAAYRVTDEMIRAMDTLDEPQKRRVLEHLKGNTPAPAGGSI